MNPSETTAKKSRIPYIFVGFFIVLFAVNAVFVTLAFKSFSGLADENAYDRGISYNDNLDGDAQQKTLGWTTDISRDRDENGVFLRLQVNRDTGEAIRQASITSKLYRPVVRGMDEPLDFQPMDDGSYVARLENIPGGNWELRVLIEAGANSYRFSQRIIL